MAFYGWDVIDRPSSCANVYIRLYTGINVPANGFITGFDIYLVGNSSVRFVVYRKVGTNYVLVGEHLTGAGTGRITVTGLAIAVNAGDMVGFTTSAGHECTSGSVAIKSYEPNPRYTAPSSVPESSWESGNTYVPSFGYTWEESVVGSPTDHWYVRPGGSGTMNGYDWDNALATVDAGMKAVASGKTLHIGFGSYTNEPADNVQSPTNANVTVVFETIGSTGGTGTSTVELN